MRNLKYIAGIVLGIALTSCSSYLSENPDQRTKIDTPEKIKELLVYAYPSANNFYPLEAMTDNFGDSRRTQNSSLDNTAYYKWEVETQESWDSPAEYWAAAYKAIAQANQALESVENVQMSKEMYEGIKGEALLARAYSHWMLAMTFCEAYDPATASSTLGIPYVDKVEEKLFETYERGTLEEVYQRLEEDIVEGVRLAKPGSFFGATNYSFHFTKDAGRALAARFFAFKGDFDKVMEYTEFLGDRPENLRNYANYTELMPSEQGQLFGSQREKANLLVAGTRSIISRTYGAIRFGIVRDIALARRSSAFNPFNKEYVYDIYWRNQDVYFYPRFYEYFVYSNQSAGIGQPYVNVSLLSTDEAYLFRIEAAIMKGEYDRAAKMMGYFAKFRTTGFNNTNNENTVTQNTILNKVSNANEYQPFFQVNDTQRKMLKFVAEMRRSEFLQMGNRWYDIKRYNIPVTHRFLIEGTEEVLTAKDPRKAVQLPQSALGAGLTPNPR